MIFHLLEMLFCMHAIQIYQFHIFMRSLHIKHFIDVEIFLAIRQEVMFMRDEDLPTCKLSRLGDSTGGGIGRGGGLTLIIQIDEGG